MGVVVGYRFFMYERIMEILYNDKLGIMFGS